MDADGDSGLGGDDHEEAREAQKGEVGEKVKGGGAGWHCWGGGGIGHEEAQRARGNFADGLGRGKWLRFGGLAAPSRARTAAKAAAGLPQSKGLRPGLGEMLEGAGWLWGGRRGELLALDSEENRGGGAGGEGGGGVVVEEVGGDVGGGGGGPGDGVGGGGDAEGLAGGGGPG